MGNNMNIFHNMKRMYMDMGNIHSSCMKDMSSKNTMGMRSYNKNSCCMNSNC